MGRNTFKFEGGEDLTTMGAGWFVSFCYNKNINSSHKNWTKIKTVKLRSSVYRKTKHFHKFWLTKVLDINDGNLNRNRMDLKATDIKCMAKQLLELPIFKSS